jgi:hypothetical protein
MKIGQQMKDSAVIEPMAETMGRAELAHLSILVFCLASPIIRAAATPAVIQKMPAPLRLAVAPKMITPRAQIQMRANDQEMTDNSSQLAR